MTDAQEFWALVSRDEPGCWIWQGRYNRGGYGYVVWHGRTVRAHRLAYQLRFGPIPSTLAVCHSCDVRACVNPGHLWLGTQRENQDDCTRKGRRPYGDRHGSRTHPDSVRVGVKNGRAKVTPEQIAALRASYQRGAPKEQHRLARQFGISQTQVSRILRAESWRIQ